jgi:hypothetical protein
MAWGCVFVCLWQCFCKDVEVCMCGMGICVCVCVCVCLLGCVHVGLSVFVGVQRCRAAGGMVETAAKLCSGGSIQA